MLCDAAFELIKQVDQADEANGMLPAYNEHLMRQVHKEINSLYEHNSNDSEKAQSDPSLFPTLMPDIHIRQAAIHRNRRCASAYVMHRARFITGVRWQLGNLMPPEIRVNLSDNEVKFANSYNKLLARYMRSLGGLDITQDQQPPKSLHVHVRCIKDVGQYETSDGRTVMLRSGTDQLMARTDAELLIRQGLLEHVG